MKEDDVEPIILDGEIWKDIPDYEGIYQASNLGRIRTSPQKTTFTNLHGVRHWKCRIMKGRGNYRTPGKRVSLWKNGQYKDWLVARLVAITFLGKPTKEANTVNHINGDRLDNRIENLEWLSIGDNIRHAFDTGLMKYKKVRLYNKDCDLLFRSLSTASKYLGKTNAYLSNCKNKNKYLVKDKNGIKYYFEQI